MKNNEGALRPKMAAALLLVLFRKIWRWDHNPRQLNNQQRGQHRRSGNAHGAREDPEAVSFHDMRHTFAMLSLKSGVDVRTLSETLGHFSAGFTLSTYVHSTPGMKQSAADVIGNTIRNAI